ncbi:hypothetical protein ACQ86D_50675 [Streptomyces galilaeus]
MAAATRAADPLAMFLTGAYRAGQVDQPTVLAENGGSAAPKGSGDRSIAREGRPMKHVQPAGSPFVGGKRFVADVLLWGMFVVGLAASAAAGAVVDGGAKNGVAVVGGVVALITGSRIARKPKIKAFLGRPGTMWFLFLFNGVAAVVLYFALDGAKGVIGATCMGLVSLGAAGGLVASRRKQSAAKEPRD